MSKQTKIVFNIVVLWNCDLVSNGISVVGYSWLPYRHTHTRVSVSYNATNNLCERLAVLNWRSSSIHPYSLCCCDSLKFFVVFLRLLFSRLSEFLLCTVSGKMKSYELLDKIAKYETSLIKFMCDDYITEQETELSLTNRATRLEVSQGHQTWYHSMLRMVSYYCAIAILSVFWDIRLQKMSWP